ncbi:MAG: rod shape-determining protein MreC [Calditrichaeota bacterium]|nr:MAG: rod shape-determining protein MreC [Calditrichota bacterium]
MKRLLTFFSLNRSLWLLLFYIFLSLLLMNFSDGRSLRGVRLVLLQTIEWIDEIKEAITVHQNMEKELLALKKENFDLRLTNIKLREVLIENARLRKLLELKTSSPYHLVAARVIGKGTEEGIRTLILNVGEDDSVRINMAVVNADGLVGRIISTTTSESIVQILMDHNSLVSARLQQSREVGVVGWSGNSWLDLQYISKNIPVKRGELVITSGLSQIYPPGLKIGVVADIIENEYDWFKEIRVKPAVNFNAVEEVFVIRALREEKRDE